jgi:hypothetical protein
MSYQWIYRDVLDRIFVQLRQMGYASMQIRKTAAARSSRLPLNDTRRSGSYVSLLGLAEHKGESTGILSDSDARREQFCMGCEIDVAR